MASTFQYIYSDNSRLSAAKCEAITDSENCWARCTTLISVREFTVSCLHQLYCNVCRNDHGNFRSRRVRFAKPYKAVRLYFINAAHQVTVKYRLLYCRIVHRRTIKVSGFGRVSRVKVTRLVGLRAGIGIVL